jgi:hypothetical protein
MRIRQQTELIICRYIYAVYTVHLLSLYIEKYFLRELCYSRDEVTLKSDVLSYKNIESKLSFAWSRETDSKERKEYLFLSFQEIYFDPVSITFFKFSL